MAQRGLDDTLNDVLPNEILNEVWRSHYQDYAFLNRASLVCKFWQLNADEIARNRYCFYFPDLYEKGLNKIDDELGISISWSRRLELALLQYCCAFTPQELADYRALRVGDWKEIQKILSASDAVERILLKDNQQRTGFYYFAKNHAHPHRQKIFDDIYNTLDADNKVNNGEWKEILFDKDIEIDWGVVIKSVKKPHFIPEMLMFAVICGQTSEIKKALDIIQQNNKLSTCLAGLLSLALRYDQIEAFLLMLDYGPSCLFAVNDLFVGRNISQHFANKLFEYVCKMDLKDDPGKRRLMHWTLILNQPSYFSSIQTQACQLDKMIIIYPYIRYIRFNEIKLQVFHPLNFACLWGVDLYKLAVAYGALCVSVHNLLEVPAICGDGKLLQQLLSIPEVCNEARLAKAMNAAIKHGHLNCVKLLLRCNIEINIAHIITAFETKQIHILDFFCKDEVYRELINTRLLSCCKQINFTPLMRWFLEDCHIPLLKMLLKFGLNVHEVGGQNKTPLHFLAGDVKENHSVLMTNLVARGAVKDKLDIDNCTPLHCAAKVCSHIDSNAAHHMMVLIQLGADPYIKDGANQTVFDILKCHLSEDDFVKIENGMLPFCHQQRPAVRNC